VAVSDAALVVVLYGLVGLGRAMGAAWLTKTYVIPYLIVNFWLVCITLLQHSHPGQPLAHGPARLGTPLALPRDPTPLLPVPGRLALQGEAGRPADRPCPCAALCPPQCCLTTLTRSGTGCAAR
jgi:hypothetical protein